VVFPIGLRFAVHSLYPYINVYPGNIWIIVKPRIDLMEVKWLTFIKSLIDTAYHFYIQSLINGQPVFRTAQVYIYLYSQCLNLVNILLYWH